MTTLDEGIRKHRQWRADTSQFPLPSPEDCIVYATTEAAEVRSAILAEKNPDHVRSKRYRNSLMECIDAFYMLDSVLMQINPEFETDHVQFTNNFDPDRVAKAYLDYAGGGELPNNLDEVIPEVSMFLAAWRNTFWVAAGEEALGLLNDKLEILEERVDAA